MCLRWQQSCLLLSLKSLVSSLKSGKKVSLCGCFFGAGRFRRNHFARAAFAFDLRAGRGAESVSADGQLLSEFTVAEDFDAIRSAIGKAGIAQSGFVHPRAIIEAIERFEIHWQ